MVDIRRRWRSSFLLILCFFFLKTQLSFGADTISANEPLTGDQTILSSGGTFRLGFFHPGNSSNYYIGMWYDKVSIQTVVWVANRNKPISDRFSSQLKLLNGNLVLLNESNIPIWSTNVNSTASNSTQAVLLEDGNLILRDGPNSSAPIWQSFDHPAHTWLPGSKLGIDKRTNTTQLLTSWKNSEDPSEGLFALELDLDGTNQYIIKWNRSEQYWTSGPWDDNAQIFSLVPEMRLDYIYNFTYVNDASQSYFFYSVKNPSIISRFVMDVSGQIKQYNWLDGSKEWFLFWSQPRQQCEVYTYCGAFSSCNEDSLPFCKCLDGFEPKSMNEWSLNDFSSGCVRKKQLQCEANSSSNTEKDKFLPKNSMKLPVYAQSQSAENAVECENLCLNNCSCSAYAYNNSGCSIWTDELLNIQQLSPGASTGQFLYLRLAASEFSKRNGKKKLVIGAVVGSIVGIGVSLLILLVVIMRRRKSIGSGKAVEGTLLSFGYRDMQNATKNFSDKLGGGAFGSVFKGYLPDSTVIAVKKLESISQGEKQFRTEVSTIGTIQHVNLVRLRGFSSEGSKRLLVYDYMPNGSLDSHLFSQENDPKFLDWKTRFQIALGTARGLAYLHEKCRDCIIHCDIKPENVLLDSDFCPKVADFGLAKLMGREFSRVLTTMRGTRGYLAPEWISGVAITAKADVYSYGMMLFELVSGKRNSDVSEEGKLKFFPTLVASKLAQEENLLDLLDSRLNGIANVEELIRVCRVACWSVQDDEAHRPSMGQIVQILEGFLVVNLPPIPRSLQVFVDNQEHIVFFTDSSSGQSSGQRTNASNASSQTKSTASVES